MLKEADALTKPELTEQGILPYDFFLDSQMIVLKYVTQQMQPVLDKHMAERRALMATTSADKYDTATRQSMTEDAMYWDLCKKNADRVFYSHLSIQPSPFMKSGETYLMDPNKRTEYEEKYN